MIKQRSGLVAILLVTALFASPAPYVAAFGTIDSGGQHREHERITRASLACASAAQSDDCFASRSIDFLAGHDREFGAVGAPDSDEISDPSAHCDNADYLEAAYPRSHDMATADLQNCVDHLRSRFQEAVAAAQGLLDGDGQIISTEVNFDAECKVFEANEVRAKCLTLKAFGRALHGAQDFYAHSNWADEADPNRAIGDGNPPGLNLPGPSPMLDMRTQAPPTVPAGFTTGCYVLRDEVPGVGDCADRVTHAALNKDNGLIDPNTGATIEPSTTRGVVADNFAKAVTGAISETRRQWQDYQLELASRYGKENASVMTCALTHDDPVNDCRNLGWIRIIAGILIVAVVLSIALGLLYIHRRRRTAGAGSPTGTGV